MFFFKFCTLSFEIFLEIKKSQF
uniref:Uncharacterized protein n=1 Tax=Lepeophtheirus salmonis TaxID=72036 RepID=A0A0K2UZQ3_LEPSM